MDSCWYKATFDWNWAEAVPFEVCVCWSPQIPLIPKVSSRLSEPGPCCLCMISRNTHDDSLRKTHLFPPSFTSFFYFPSPSLPSPCKFLLNYRMPSTVLGSGAKALNGR